MGVLKILVCYHCKEYLDLQKSWVNDDVLGYIKHHKNPNGYLKHLIYYWGHLLEYPMFEFLLRHGTCGAVKQLYDTAHEEEYYRIVHDKSWREVDDEALYRDCEYIAFDEATQN